MHHSRIPDFTVCVCVCIVAARGSPEPAHVAPFPTLARTEEATSACCAAGMFTYLRASISADYGRRRSDFFLVCAGGPPAPESESACLSLLSVTSMTNTSPSTPPPRAFEASCVFRVDSRTRELKPCRSYSVCHRTSLRSLGFLFACVTTALSASLLSLSSRWHTCPQALGSSSTGGATLFDNPRLGNSAWVGRLPPRRRWSDCHGSAPSRARAPSPPHTNVVCRTRAVDREATLRLLSSVLWTCLVSPTFSCVIVPCRSLVLIQARSAATTT
mmetsp:Transcript_35014/g.108055  ORF Transcript_35014/g.108055 Transcript_35014/m.108055 type:complete len:273 (+) Transcript_35014:944-1762(+)